ncbi:MAG: Glycosyltransferase [Parcubacteria group bacterium GW2011_GWA2_40_14]|nr:MAG: Glycosyltransferase [Parcubacteria group bacterium GW2011_GWA2_40_14]
MKVVSISTDRKLFEEGSVVLTRQKYYAERMEELHVIVFSLSKNGYKYRSFGNLHLYPMNSSSRISFLFDAYRLGKKIILENSFKKENSVITTQDSFETGLVGYLLKKKFNLPLQLQIHTDFLNSYFKNSSLNLARVVLAKFLIPKADGLRVVSSVISGSLQKEFPNLKTKIDILPIFIDIEKIKNSAISINLRQKYPDRFIILMASRVTKEKNIILAIKLVSSLIRANKRIVLLIVGDGPEKKTLQLYAKDMGGYVVFEPWTLDLTSYYKTADVFLLTSQYEGYGMTLIEAGASGCPIVTTNVGIAKTDLFKNGENAFVCPVGDVDCLSKAIIDLIENPEKRKLFKERMQDSIKRVTVSKEEYVYRYVAMLENLL